MGRAGVHLAGAALFEDRLRAVAEGARGVDHVVDDDRLFAAHVADDVHDFRDVGALAAFVHDGQRHVEPLGEFARAGDRAEVGETTTISSRGSPEKREPK